MKTARFEETHSPGARHATAWLEGSPSAGHLPFLSGSEVLTLTVVCTFADADLLSKSGYYGISADLVSSAMRIPITAARRRLERLVEVGALITRTGLAGSTRYWLPEEVRLP